MNENLIGRANVQAMRWITFCLMISLCFAVAGCQSSVPKSKPDEESRPPVVQDMDIVQPDSSN